MSWMHSRPLAVLSRARTLVVASVPAWCNAPPRNQALLDAIWEALNIARDNKALVLASEGTILNVNQLTSQLCGQSLVELVGKKISALFDGVPAQHPHADRWETALRTASGNPIAVEVTRQAVGTKLKHIQVYAIRDLRERRAAMEERKRQSKALQQRDEELRKQHLLLDAAIRNMPFGLCIVDADQRLVIANNVYAEMYCVPPELMERGTVVRQIIEHRLAKGIYSGPDGQRYLRERFEPVNETTSKTYELSDGRIVLVSRQPMENGGSIAIHQDITEREVLNARLAQQHQQLDAAMDNMLQGLAMFDAEQRLIVCNKRYAKMYGLTPDQVKPGTTVRQIFEYRLANGFYHVRDTETFVDSWTSSFGEVSSRIQELADGRIISVSRCLMPNGGRLITHEDITERQKLNARLEQQHGMLEQHEQKLRAQNVQLDAALNNMVQGLAMFDAQFRVVIANERFAKMYGLTPEQVSSGTTLRQILEYRAANGHDAGKAVDDTLKAVLSRLTEKPSNHYLSELTDGRCIAVSAQRMSTAPPGEKAMKPCCATSPAMSSVSPSPTAAYPKQASGP
jgi:PAS domain-containing protein